MGCLQPITSTARKRFFLRKEAKTFYPVWCEARARGKRAKGWVEHGRAPDAIAASTRPESPVQHRLPLCPYPKQARYGGTGELTDPANWSCAGGTSG
jgi:hypothetical protein